MEEYQAETVIYLHSCIIVQYGQMESRQQTKKLNYLFSTEVYK